MSYLSTVTTAKQQKPRRTLIYGVSGIGKTTWAAQWPGAIVLPTEDGVDGIDVPHFPLCKTFADAGGPLIELSGDAEHPYKTLVVDSADWLEKLIWKSLCEKHGKEHISDFGYGKGYAEAAGKLQQYLGYLDSCRSRRDMHIVVVAHATVTRFEDPEGDSYDRYQPKLHKESAALLTEWADEVLFANYETFTRKSDEGFGRERAVGTGTGARVLHTQEMPAYKAKNRLGLPPKLPLDFAEYKKFLSIPNEVEVE